MDVIEQQLARPRRMETISAELDAANKYRWQLLKIAADFRACEPPQPFYIDPSRPYTLIPVLPQVELPSELNEALRLQGMTVALLERELYEAYQRYSHRP